MNRQEWIFYGLLLFGGLKLKNHEERHPNGDSQVPALVLRERAEKKRLFHGGGTQRMFRGVVELRSDMVYTSYT
jgi:hypothetical protein